MLAHFDNETEHGKLFISYPMVEAIRDIDDPTEYLTRTINLEDCAGKVYKHLSDERGNECYQVTRRIDKPAWKGLISANLQKANTMVNSIATQNPVIDQHPIAQAQLEQFLPINKVAVLSAFPIFSADYFGKKVFDL